MASLALSGPGELRYDLTLPDEVTWDAAEVADAGPWYTHPRCGDSCASRLGPRILHILGLDKHVAEGFHRRSDSRRDERFQFNVGDIWRGGWGDR